MKEILCRTDYEQQIAASRDRRMQWWREARFGLFIHYGLYSLLGRNEWAMVHENMPIDEYERLANTFCPKPDAPREWAALARKAGMKYMILTTRHHEGFSLWDSKVNPYNSVNFGAKRDLVREFVAACREYGLGVGLYSSLGEWRHPDSWRCAFDTEARRRYHRYVRELNTELLTRYGKIDILWYDGGFPMESGDGWDALELNQHMRSLQPDIIINNRSWTNEDFGTSEGHVTAEEREWEACMTFKDISWGHGDSRQAAPYSYTPQRIIKMLRTCAGGGGNLLLNIGPAPDGSVPEEAVQPLTRVGDWLKENGRAVYGKLVRNKMGWISGGTFGANGVSDVSSDGKSIFVWNWIWPAGGSMTLGGYRTAPKAVRLLKDGTPVDFELIGHRLVLKNLPPTPPDRHAGITVIELVYDGLPPYRFASDYPQLHGGQTVPEGSGDQG